jgi:hypothetical protein
VLNTNGESPAYLPKPVGSQITSSQLFVKNRVINSTCEYTTPAEKRIHPYSTALVSIPAAMMRPFIAPSPAQEGSCGLPAIVDKRTQLGSMATESFVAGFDNSNCISGIANSNANCRQKVANNAKLLSTYAIANPLSGLNENAEDIRALGDDILGTAHSGGNGTATRFDDLKAKNDADTVGGRSKYLNPRDTVFTTTAVRLSDAEKSVSQQNSMFVMGIAASVALGLFAAQIAAR